MTTDTKKFVKYTRSGTNHTAELSVHYTVLNPDKKTERYLWTAAVGMWFDPNELGYKLHLRPSQDTEEECWEHGRAFLQGFGFVEVVAQ